MCGRYGLSRADSVPDRFETKHVLDVQPELFEPRYNIAPTQDVLTVAYSKRVDTRAVKSMRWGLVASWAVEDRTKPRPINVKTENILDRPAYRRLLAEKRCIIPADGFYEWQKRANGARQPYSIELADGGLFGLAGIWDAVKTGDEWLVSCAILTTAPNQLVSQLHNRMPVIVRPEDEALWLDHDCTDAGELAPLLSALPQNLMAMYPVAALVNNVNNEGPDLRSPPEPTEEQAALGI